MVGPVPPSWAVDPGDAGVREVVPGLWRLRLPTAWDVIERLDVDTALPGHGRPIDDLRLAVAEHRAGVGERVAATEEALRVGPAPGYEITARLFGEPPSEMMRVWQLVEVVSYLRHLRLAGRVVREEMPDGTFRHRCALGSGTKS